VKKIAFFLGFMCVSLALPSSPYSQSAQRGGDAGCEEKNHELDYADPHGRGVLVVELLSQKEISNVKTLLASYGPDQTLEGLRDRLRIDLKGRHWIYVLNPAEFEMLSKARSQR
jgi:hypothetical protein